MVWHSATAGSAAIVLLLSTAASGQSFEKLVDLRCEALGCAPNARMVQGGDGVLYGTTSEGGAQDGTIFRVDAAGTVTLVDSLPQPSQLIAGSDGFLYGTVSEGAAVFRMDPTGVVEVVREFEEFSGTLHFEGRDGQLYGTGGWDEGVVFRMDRTGAGVTVLASFDGSGAGYPRRLIEGADGRLYGTTYYGGTWGAGTAFRVEPAGTITVLYSFRSPAGSDTSTAYADVIQGSDGFFYGTSMSGGAFGLGVAFRMSSTGDVQVLHSFDGATGRSPLTAPIEGRDGLFYGTAASGGPGGAGTIYRMDRSGAVTVLQAFDGTTGRAPVGGLLQAADGALYGTTAMGGAYDHGVVFRLVLPFGVTLVWPDGGERVFAGFPATVRWMATGSPVAFTLELSRDDGRIWEPIAGCTGLVGSDTSCGWIPTGPRTPRARVRVTAFAATGAAVSDTSGGRVEIVTGQPRIMVTVPQPGMRWVEGSTQAIRWNHNLGPQARFRVDISRDGGATWEVLASAVTPGRAGSFSWTVTGPTSATAVFRVAWVDGPAEDWSRGLFAIEATGRGKSPHLPANVPPGRTARERQAS